MRTTSGSISRKSWGPARVALFRSSASLGPCLSLVSMRLGYPLPLGGNLLQDDERDRGREDREQPTGDAVQLDAAEPRRDREERPDAHRAPFERPLQHQLLGDLPRRERHRENDALRR